MITSPEAHSSPIPVVDAAAWEQPASKSDAGTGSAVTPPANEYASRIAHLESKVDELEGLNKALKSQNIQLSTQLRTLRAKMGKRRSSQKNREARPLFGSASSSSRRSHSETLIACK